MCVFTLFGIGMALQDEKNDATTMQQTTFEKEAIETKKTADQKWRQVQKDTSYKS